MKNREVEGRIHSIQTLGTLDGPGVRFVLFMQGCPLRCACCHNPDTWDMEKGKAMTAGEVFDKILRCKSYYGTDGGVTVSGGEPLCQPEFVKALFELCKNEGINTCLDTSGCMISNDIKDMLYYTDLVLLDIKYTQKDDYIKYVGCDMKYVMDFLEYLDENKIKTWLRQVLIIGKNDNDENIKSLANISNGHSCVEKCQLLPFKKICEQKYSEMGVDFPFSHIEETDIEILERFSEKLQLNL